MNNFGECEASGKELALSPQDFRENVILHFAEFSSQNFR
jgi:hypothetical protein